MNHFFRGIGTLLFALIPFSTVLGEYENTIHNFDAMYHADPATIELGSGSTTGTTSDGFTYTCGGTAAKFWVDHVYETKIGINLLSFGDYVVVSPAITNLTEIAISFEPASEKRNTIWVYLSTDGVNWGDPLREGIDDISYTKGGIRALVPMGNYYIKIFDSNGSNDTSIMQINYTSERCNCFRYVP